ncbi:MAG TPA: glucoamylase family protein [Thermoanaerobaculia bacterium]|nr:glucoamylase family protein [Thermoanaerobaculia bacterium]
MTRRHAPLGAATWRRPPRGGVVVEALDFLEEPLRAELFGTERLEQHAESLAQADRASDSAAEKPPAGRDLLARVRENARALLDGYRSIAETAMAKHEITPAAEWILDNFHVVDEQLREIRDHLPEDYYRALPKIASGQLAGYPRVYGLAWAYVAHTDSRFELETLQRFVAAYQRAQPLTVGELWAIAIHLRIALVENLRRLSELINQSRRQRAHADELSNRLLGLDGQPSEAPDRVLKGLGDVHLGRAFAVQLVQRIRGQDPSTMPALVWLDQRLSAQGTSAEDAVAQEHQAQAAANVTVRNIVTSMRWMSSIDWPDFFESVSLLDEVLRSAPGFAAMDFATRDEYRGQIEQLSRGSGRSEIEVAREAVRLARAASEESGAATSVSGIPQRAEEDPGYYVVAAGRRAFEKRLGFRVPLRTRLRRAFRDRAMSGYLGGIAALTALILGGLLLSTRSAGAAGWTLALLGILGLVPASDLAVSLVHRLVPLLVPPRLLPKLELAGGVPAELRTLVVVPTLLSRAPDIAGQLGGLEVHYLANPRGHLHFALLTDWTDAAAEHRPGDEELVAALAAGVADLNQRYGSPPGGGKRFLLLHRRRVWNREEGAWIGWERKRGKLHELNRLLRGAADTTFVAIDGEPPTVPAGVRYVITLDADTRLPMGSARRLVGAMAHPLNRPRFDPGAERVVDGYAILQPRVTPSLPTGPGSSTYQRILSGPGGVDPYAAAVSDVYQDLFNEGSYTGKGIYDVDAFEQALAGRAPENTLLSHDLFESSFARTGLATDVDLFEQFPTNYEVAARRQHRWVRGDWQLLPWILGRADGPSGNRRTAGIHLLGRWKMVDNLRRSLVAPSALLVALAGWILPTVPPLLWTGLLVGSIAVPAFIPVLNGLVPRRSGVSKRSHLRAVGHDLSVASSQTLLSITMLAFQAWLMVDAIARTIGRLYLTKRHLLEWVTAAQAGHGRDLRLRAFYRHLRWGVVVAVGACLLVVALKPSAWPVAVPFVLLWMLSPIVAWRISLPARPAKSQRPSPEDARALRQIARRTWRYFEDFVDERNHHLPPDNFQEIPEPVEAHRTSPTNMGLYLLAITVARDLGWIGRSDMVDRLEATLGTMSRLERVRGHLLNWYDTHDLRPLEPRYVSTVDSGNLAGSLIALARACSETAYRPLTDPQIFEGIGDSVRLLIDSTRAEDADGVRSGARAELHAAAQALAAVLGAAPGSAPERIDLLRALESRADHLVEIARTLPRRGEDPSGGARRLDEGGCPREPSIWARAVRDSIRSHLRDLELDQEALAHRLSALTSFAEGIVRAMDFRFLLDPTSELFSIGYRVGDGSLDPGRYDLLASEARLASFVAIAKGDVPPQHWFQLGRSLTPVGGGAALVSWSGSMFEYLLPLLLMTQPPQSLLDLSCRLVVGRQIRYGAQRRVPWGVSESAYNVRDAQLTYQYTALGVPGLGLKRGLFEDVVVAPYATALAAMVDSGAALANFDRLEAAGALGVYGFYEALDYTPSRLPARTPVVVVRAYMAHHQAMTLVALANVLDDGSTRRRFHSHPLVQAAELLLQERTPRAVAITRPRAEEVQVAPLVRELLLPTLRRFDSPHDVTPRTHLLSNGRYTVMVTAAGAGFSRWRDLAVTRWREDTTRDCWGTFVFLRDVETGGTWSAGFQPSGTAVDRYDVVYCEDRVSISQTDGSLSITLEIVVSSEDDAELRRLTVTNLEDREREIDFTSYAEIVLATQAADEAHPTFSNLFVQTELVPALGTLLATRRQRSADDPPVWLAHLAAVDGAIIDPPQHETDRARFLGRGREVRTAASVIDGLPLSGSTGTVLDPIVSLRHRVALPARGTVRLVYTTLVAPSREEALDTADKYRQSATFERESTLAWTRAQVQLHHLGIRQDEAHLFQRLANRLLYTDPTLRASRQVLAANRSGPSRLWTFGISGDLPIALVRVAVDAEREVVAQLLRAHEYWRLKGVPADLVILTARNVSYAQYLQQSVAAMVRSSPTGLGHDTQGEHGKVFVLREDLMSPADVTLMLSVARLSIVAGRGSLSEQVARAGRLPTTTPRALTVPATAETTSAPALELEHFNGLGGFTPDGREYVTVLDDGQWTPAPWINVVANPLFGFQVSEAGAGSTWSMNSRQNKLTPWSNDPVSDTPGEALYVRDEDSGQVWSPTCLPIREHSRYVIRHGQGYSRFEHTSHGIALDLLMLVPPDDPVKVSRLSLENLSPRTRRISVTAYAEWVLGVTRSASAPFVVTGIDDATGAMLACNPWNEEFASRVAFADLGGLQSSWTGDRLEFMGRNGSPARPGSLADGEPLSGTTGAGFDPCAALQTVVELEPGQRTEVRFLLGQGGSREEVQSLVERYRTTSCDQLLAEARERWDRLLGAVQVRTPDRSMNLLLNRWLLYQTVSCRIWSRSALYQAGGAYGFRDQLQDVLALMTTRPDITREHILRAAARQFEEGDVQHWWHPETGRGVRTRISDDRLWLSYAVIEYARSTGDQAVLDEQVPWLEGPPLDDGQQEAYFEPSESERRDTLFEHCARAMDRSLELGGRGLPLIGAGDWNDGMNRVGHEGRGESVWLGWFLLVNSRGLAGIAELRGETERASRWRRTAASLEVALDREAWDGAWYRRAFFDDGTPLGSTQNDECRIDSISQSWAVLAGAGDPDRARQGMDAVNRLLVRPADRLLLLLSPPFDRTPLDPGYIKGYPPGIRENGGQYTHAATWSLLAFARLGDGDKAAELFGLIDPIRHASTPDGVSRYKVEPYAVAADVYSESPHVGRGGWTWYTGAAGWLHRVALEGILGFEKRGDALHLDPCIPRGWPGFEIAYRYGAALYQITVDNPRGVCRGVSRISLDGIQLATRGPVPLVDDGLEHRVELVLG